jgi:hypothetical protein
MASGTYFKIHCGITSPFLQFYSDAGCAMASDMISSGVSCGSVPALPSMRFSFICPASDDMYYSDRYLSKSSYYTRGQQPWGPHESPVPLAGDQTRLPLSVASEAASTCIRIPCVPRSYPDTESRPALKQP